MGAPASISKDSFIGMVTVSWLAILLLGGAWVGNLYWDFRRESEALREEHYAAQRRLVRQEVRKALALVNQMRSMALDDLWGSLHGRADRAVSLGATLAERTVMSRAGVRQAVIEAVSAASDGEGFYGTVDQDLVFIEFIPASLDRETTVEQLVDSLIEVDDGRRSVGIFDRTTGIEWTFLAVVRDMGDGARVMACACLEKAEMRVKEVVADRLELQRFSGDNYIFAGDWNGVSKAGPARGRNMWGVVDDNGVRVVQELVAAAKRGGDFVTYVMPDIGGLRSQEKISYAMPVQDWQWYVGAGVYVDDIESVVAESGQRLERDIHRQLAMTLAGLVFLSLLALFMARRMARRIDANVRTFTETWNKASSIGGKVDPESLRYEEFRVLAEAANRMARECHDAENAMQDTAERFETLVSNIPGCVYHCALDEQCTMSYVSDPIETITGYPASDFIDNSVRSFASIIDPADRDQVKQMIRRDVEAGRPYSLEFRIIHANGEIRWISARGQARQDELGGVQGVDGVFFDITAKRRNEHDHYVHMHFLETMERLDRDLRRSSNMDSMLSDAMETVRQAFGADRAWLLTPCDHETQTYRIPVERSAKEFPGAGATKMDIPLSDEVREVMRRVLETSGPVAFDPASGLSVPRDTRQAFGVQSQLLVAVYPRSGPPWLMGLHQCRAVRIWNSDEIRLFKEMSRRVSDALSTLLMHRELRESEERFRTFSEQTMLGMSVMQDNHFLFVNQAFADIFEMAVEEVQRLPLNEFNQFVHPEDRDFVVEQARRKLSGDPDVVPTYVWRALTTSGTIRWVEIHSRTVTLNGRHADLISLLDITDRPQEELDAKLRERRRAAGEGDIAEG